MDLAGPKDIKIKGRHRLFRIFRHLNYVLFKDIQNGKPQASIVSSTEMMVIYQMVSKFNRFEKLRVE